MWDWKYPRLWDQPGRWEKGVVGAWRWDLEYESCEERESVGKVELLEELSP